MPPLYTCLQYIISKGIGTQPRRKDALRYQMEAPHSEHNDPLVPAYSGSVFPCTRLTGLCIVGSQYALFEGEQLADIDIKR